MASLALSVNAFFDPAQQKDKFYGESRERRWMKVIRNVIILRTSNAVLARQSTRSESSFFFPIGCLGMLVLEIWNVAKSVGIVMTRSSLGFLIQKKTLYYALWGFIKSQSEYSEYHYLAASSTTKC
jgi:hypothetical protein